MIVTVSVHLITSVMLSLDNVSAVQTRMVVSVMNASLDTGIIQIVKDVTAMVMPTLVIHELVIVLTAEISPQVLNVTSKTFSAYF